MGAVMYGESFKKEESRLFIFWGVNDNAILLANSIRKKAAEPRGRMKKDGRIVNSFL